jgi:Ty3 transposon capsid-like protein
MPRNTLNSRATDLDVDRAAQVQNAQIVPDFPTHSRQNTPTPSNNQDQLDDQNDDDHISNSFQDQTTPSLAEAIMLMTAELRRRDTPSKPTSSGKVKEPDTFDGSDPKKLNNFILLCNLYFRNNSAYSDDNAKVTFALTHLRGTALEFFEPMLTSDDQLDWEDDWQEFIRVLRTQFGPIDPTADAEDNIDNLKMKDNQHILKYNVEFNRLAVQTGWEDSVLRHRYYSGLAERIKDIMGQQGKPSTLEGMKTIAHSIDARHWERIREKSRSGSDKTNTNSGNKSDKKPSTSNNSNSSNNSNNSNNANKNQSKGSGSNNSNNNNKNDKSKSSTNPLTDKLGKDGKLTPQERQRRFDNNLCMFCGGTGHTANNCSKSTSSASKAKARAATTDSSKKEDPKK